MRYQVILTVASPAPAFPHVIELETAICREIGETGDLACSVSGRDDFSFHILTRSPDAVLTSARQVLMNAGYLAISDRAAAMQDDWDRDHQAQDAGSDGDDTGHQF